MKYPKESCLKPTKNISDKKYGFFKRTKFFEEAAKIWA
jgi:dGTPase